MTRKSPFRISRYSLRFLLLLTTLAAILFGTWSSQIEPYRRQAAGFERFHALTNTNAQSLPVQLDVSSAVSDAPGPDWQRRLVALTLGKSKYIRVHALKFPRGTDESDVLFVLSRMPFLQSVVLDRCDLSAGTLQWLASLPMLSEVQAKYCDISDDEMESLATSPTIRRLILTGNPVSDDSVATLTAMKSLGELYIRWTDITDSGHQTLLRAKPACEVHFESQVQND